MLLMVLIFLLSCVVYIVHTLLDSSNSSHVSNTIDDFIDLGPDCSEDISDVISVDRYKTVYTDPGKQILILYATEYGFSEDVARKLYDRLVDFSVSKDDIFQPRILNAKDYELISFDQEQLLLLVIATSGDGVSPSDARPWYNDVMTTDSNLRHLNYSVLALGDSNYRYFCRAGQMIDSRLLYLGANRLIERSNVDMEDWTVINDWIKKIISCLETVVIETRVDYMSSRLPCNNDGYCRTRPFVAKMKVKRNLTTVIDSDDKETIHCEFDLSGSGLEFISGDALGIYPCNDPTDVEQLLSVLGSTGQEQLNPPQWAYQPKPDGKISLKKLLQMYYDLKNIKPELLKVIQHGQKDMNNTLNRLLVDGLSVKKNKMLDEYLKKREVVDVLKEFNYESVAMETILTNMKGLQPRYYSISSSPLKDKNTACITVAVVRYKVLGKLRSGVATTHLQDRMSVIETCPVFISRNTDFRLPMNKNLPIIMIGPGTGIAPFRAFIQERIHDESVGKNILYFGCRNKDKDFLYHDEMETWVNEGHLTLRTAFSRDQKSKIYVQDLLIQDACLVWKTLQDGGHLYVCGDAKHMSNDVHSALLDVCQSQGNMDQSEASKYLTLLEESQRYQKDVWVT
ncbi:NADPH oxidoreductase A-like [Saccoglossus kowalevskii]|uniref:NADPH oxidoreductase A-like n=1 Tax=Saccoglossus kowalevskii TaxID=10224 RepID=A0ABM0MZ77_SACKO|nr:PREDICTED: NADPH oxidoreductase A-like [Saccoglossus kowalevskii]